MEIPRAKLNCSASSDALSNELGYKRRNWGETLPTTTTVLFYMSAKEIGDTLGANRKVGCHLTSPSDVGNKRLETCIGNIYEQMIALAPHNLNLFTSIKK